jgi:hypothetical protein
MSVQRVAQIFGWVFILVAILGFFTSGMSMEADNDLAPKLLGLFPVNLLHNLVHLAFGIWGVVAGRNYGAARTYCRVGGAIYLLLAVLGFIVPTTFGLIPIGGHDIWLHAVLGIALLIAGLTARDTAAARV